MRPLILWVFSFAGALSLRNAATHRDQITYRSESDTMGEVQVPDWAYWGAQTARSVQNFKIGVGTHTMPDELIQAFGVQKMACARANRQALEPQITKVQYLRD
jgi:fumarate hydratase class II